MIYRDYKIFRPGQFYHVYNRGVNKGLIFLNDQDYLEFMKRIKIILGYIPPRIVKTRIRPLPKDAFSILSYCLMPNHFHFFIKQNTDIGIDKFISKLCTSYSMYINKKYSRVGTLFQDRFKAKLIDSNEYALYLSAYIHNNPEMSENYPYSSYQEILGNRNESICDSSSLLEWINNSREEYKKFVKNFQKTSQTFKDQFYF